MTVHREKWIETVERRRTKVVRITCDRCAGEIPVNRSYDLEVTFLDEGHRTEEGWELSGDYCDGCVSKLKRLLVDNGFEIEKVDRGW